MEIIRFHIINYLPISLNTVQAAIKAKAEGCTKSDAKEFSEKVGKVAKEVAEEASKLAEAGIAGVKAGIEEAKKNYKKKNK